jgi:hypothetical protein
VIASSGGKLKIGSRCRRPLDRVEPGSREDLGMEAGQQEHRYKDKRGKDQRKVQRFCQDISNKKVSGHDRLLECVLK